MEQQLHTALTWMTPPRAPDCESRCANSGGSCVAHEMKKAWKLEEEHMWTRRNTRVSHGGWRSWRRQTLIPRLVSPMTTLNGWNNWGGRVVARFEVSSVEEKRRCKLWQRCQRAIPMALGATIGDSSQEKKGKLHPTQEGRRWRSFMFFKRVIHHTKCVLKRSSDITICLPRKKTLTSFVYIFIVIMIILLSFCHKIHFHVDYTNIYIYI